MNKCYENLQKTNIGYTSHDDYILKWTQFKMANAAKCKNVFDLVNLARHTLRIIQKTSGLI